MKKRTAYLFPGQGAQYSGMAMDFFESNAVKFIFDAASEVLEKDIKELLLSDAETLKRTDVSQPAITAANLAAAAFLGELGYIPAVCAGFSLGEYAALVCAGVLNISDCFRLVKARGQVMQIAADKLYDKSGADAAPGMAAVIGLPPEKTEELTKKWVSEGLKDLYTANFNSSKQTVISGTSEALAQAEIRFKEAGARHVIRLQVSGPFHSPLMSEAADNFANILDSIMFNDPIIPVFSNVTGKEITSGAEAKKLAVLQITNPVRWIDIEKNIAASGIIFCLETGPGRVLQGLWSDLKNNIPAYPAGTSEDIHKLINRD